MEVGQLHNVCVGKEFVVYYIELAQKAIFFVVTLKLSDLNSDSEGTKSALRPRTGAIL